MSCCNLSDREIYNSLSLNIVSELAGEKYNPNEKYNSSIKPKNLVVDVSCIIKMIWFLYQGSTKKSKTLLETTENIARAKQKLETTDVMDEAEQILGLQIRANECSPVHNLDVIFFAVAHKSLGSFQSTVRKNIKNLTYECTLFDPILDSDILCDYIDELNKYIKTRHNEHMVLFSLDEFKNFKYNSFVIIMHNTFEGDWLHPFDAGTRTDTFHTSETSTCEIPMMTAEAKHVMVSDWEKKLRATIILLPYKNDANCLIYQPEKIATHEELVSVLDTLAQGDTFEKLIKSFKPKESVRQVMPKFSLVSHHRNLSTLTRVDKVLNLFNKDFVLPTIFEDGPFDCKYLTMHNTTHFINTEMETETKSDTKALLCDGDSHGKIYCINQPFIFFVLSSFNHIIHVGIFTDEV